MRDDGNYGPGFFGVKAREEPLEIGVSTTDGGDGICVSAGGADVDSVIGVFVAPFAEFLGVCYLLDY